jgi:2-phosphosulfolactate phosphatase
MAELAFIGFKSDLATVLDQCGSARELSDRGYARDVALALELNQSDCVPILIDGAYTRFGNGILNRSL